MQINPSELKGGVSGLRAKGAACRWPVLVDSSGAATLASLLDDARFTLGQHASLNRLHDRDREVQTACVSSSVGTRVGDQGGGQSADLVRGAIRLVLRRDDDRTQERALLGT